MTFELTEAVFIALITAVSSLIGAVAGAIAVIVTSHVTAKTQLQESAISQCFDARYRACLALMNAHSSLVAKPDDPDRIEAFYEAANAACLSASPETAVKILCFRDAALDSKKKDKVSAAEALVAMQRDLSTFTIPRIEKNRWPKTLIGKRSREQK